MKSNKGRSASITQPLLTEVVERDKINSKLVKEGVETPSVGSKPLKQPDLYQDTGSGYNPGFTFPQD
jgi:hypothetical protein